MLIKRSNQTGWRPAVFVCTVAPGTATGLACVLALGCAFGCMLALTGKAQVELGTSAARAALLLDQFKVLDSRAPKPKEDLLTLQTSRFSIPSNLGLSGYFGPYKGPYLSLARAAAQRYGVPEGLFLRLIEQERGWGSKAISPKGAIGLAQLMPETARLLGVDPRVPAANLDGAARYLKTQNRAFRSWRLALAAYNAGPGAVRAHKGVPPYAETRKYIEAILKM